ncbi:ATP synthase epsilon chain [Gammaproteobacteria bacterium]
MAYSFRIDILTPEETYFSGEVISIIVPGAAGWLGVLINHAPLMTPLTKGRLELLMSDHSKKFFSIEGGFFEIFYNQATVLVEKISQIEIPPEEMRR